VLQVHWSESIFRWTSTRLGSVAGTDVAFADVRARVVRVEPNQVTGTFYGARVANLGEIEVIARGEAP
jgi:hypothetical protein